MEPDIAESVGQSVANSRRIGRLARVEEKIENTGGFRFGLFIGGTLAVEPLRSHDSIVQFLTGTRVCIIYLKVENVTEFHVKRCRDGFLEETRASRCFARQVVL